MTMSAQHSCPFVYEHFWINPYQYLDIYFEGEGTGKITISVKLYCMSFQEVLNLHKGLIFYGTFLFFDGFVSQDVSSVGIK